MDVHDPYTELGLTAQSTDAEIKAAWRRLAARWHPDRNDSPAALRKIQRINRALEEIRKARGIDPAAAAQGDDPSGAGEPRDAADAGADPGGARRSARILHHTIELSLEQALAGCVREFSGQVPDDGCSPCAGTGQAHQPRACIACGGAGQIRPALWFGWMAPTVCHACQGTGSVSQACAACEGSGRAPLRNYCCQVPIAPGTRGGELLHSIPADEGGGPGETLAIRVQLQPHPFFQLDPDGTVRCELPVDGFAWIANRWTPVPTPAGLQQMRLRRANLVYRIKGQGFPAQPGGARADCLITIVPLFPESLSSRQEAQIDRLISANTGASGTEAGHRMALWRRTLDGWHAALAEGAGQPPG